MTSARPAPGAPSRIEAFGIPGLPEVTAGAELAALLLDALDRAGLDLRPGDVVVISSKVVSKAEGRELVADSREAAIDRESVRVVAQRRTPRGLTRITQSRSGPVLAAAGVDASNVAPGTVLLLPEDPDASARRLRAGLRSASGATVGVVVSDTAGRAWRDGQVDLAVGAAGIAVIEDLRGAADDRGRPLEATVRALADEVAGLADLVKGKSDGVPAAVVRGLAGIVTEDDGPGAAALLRDRGADWFRYGHVEAVRAALGGRTAAQPVPLDGVAERLGRALEVALEPAWGGWRTGPPAARADEDPACPACPACRVCLVSDDAQDLGAALARLDAAAWSEELTVRHPTGQGATGRLWVTVADASATTAGARTSDGPHPPARGAAGPGTGAPGTAR